MRVLHAGDRLMSDPTGPHLSTPLFAPGAPRNVIEAAEILCEERPEAIALRDDVETPMTYATLLRASERLAGELVAGLPHGERTRPRVVFLVEPSPAWVVTLWAIWRAGAIAVPLSPKHPPAEVAYVLGHARPAAAILGAGFSDTLSLAAQVEDAAAAGAFEDIRSIVVDSAGATETQSVLPGPSAAATTLEGDALDPDSDALMLYTSGTTSRPKGVVITHGNLTTQLQILSAAWGITSADHALLTLPLHHVHGIVNVVLSTLYAGGEVTMLPRFNAECVTEALTHSASTVNVFMAVPTIYGRLLDAATKPGQRDAWKKAGERMRLMVSGSAALPAPLFEGWEALTGHRLLERYGMTEIGMALSNPLQGDRIPSTVGFPLPHVACRLAVETKDGTREILDGDGEGEIEIAGPSVSRGYFHNESATRDSRTPDGWFRTGDRARREGGRYSILGRLSVDILKSGGEKISALEIEAQLLLHPDVAAAAVVGVPHPDWGEEVVAVVEAASDALDVEDVRKFAKERLAAFKVPRRVVEGILPRNALGKVQKKKLVAELAPM